MVSQKGHGVLPKRKGGGIRVGVQSAVGWKPLVEDMEVLESGAGRSGRVPDEPPDVQNASNVGGWRAAGYANQIKRASERASARADERARKRASEREMGSGSSIDDLVEF